VFTEKIKDRTPLRGGGAPAQSW